MRKPVFAICEQQRCRSACASTHNFKTLASLFRTDLFESYLVENPKDRFSHDEAHMDIQETKCCLALPRSGTLDTATHVLYCGSLQGIFGKTYVGMATPYWCGPAALGTQNTPVALSRQPRPSLCKKIELSNITRKPVFRGLRPGKSRTSLLSNRRKLEAWNYDCRNYRYYTI